MRTIRNALYMSIFLGFLRKILGKVLVLPRPAHDLSRENPEDIIIYAIPAGTADNRVVEIATIRHGIPCDLDSIMDELHSYMSNAAFSWATLSSYSILSEHSSRPWVFLSENPNQLSNFNYPKSLPGIAEKIMARHVGQGYYTML